MNPINFNGADAKFGRPKDWDEERDGPCATLPVMRQPLPGNLVSHISLWVPTPEERRQLLLGSAVVLSCVGVQPVVAVGVSDLPASQLEVKLIQTPEKPTEIII